MEFLNSLEYGPIIFAILIVSGFWMFGYHSGNRFRLTRIMMRDPKEVNKEIKRLQNLIIENHGQIEYERTQEFKDKWKMDRLDAEIKTAKLKLELLQWVMNKDNN